MNIGEEEEAIELPMPVDPAKVPVHEPSPSIAPVEQPVPAGWIRIGMDDDDNPVYISMDPE